MTTPLRRRDFLAHAGSAVCTPWLVPSFFRLAQEDSLAAFAERVPGWMQEAHLPGASLAVVRAGQEVWTRGFGLRDVAQRAVVDDATVFEAASLSKPIFAYAVLTLAAEGKLDLDRPLTAYSSNPFRSRHARIMASEVADDARLGRITPRIVLSHSTGFPNWGRGKPLTLQADPGVKFGYSGEGYVYLQNVVEDVTGESLEEFAHKRVFVPLAMRSSSFVWRDDYEPRVAIGYTREGPQEKWKGKQGLAAATLHTTASDFAKFLAAMLRPHARGLSERWLSQMVRPHTPINESLSWSLGWGLEQRPNGRAFWQWGDNGEFKSFAIGSRGEQLALVMFTKQRSGPARVPGSGAASHARAAPSPFLWPAAIRIVSLN